MPDMTAAFTGTFDGQGYTIRNLTVNLPEDWAVGLFGCIANAEVGDFTLENAAADGMMMTGCVAGYTYCSEISNVKLENGSVTAHYAEMGAEGMYGGITGYAGGYPDEELGMPVTVFSNCKALNVTVEAGANAEGIGDIVGSGFYSEVLAANGAPFDQPTQFELEDCAADPAIAEE